MIHVKAAALQGMWQILRCVCSPGESWQRIELGMLPLMGIGFPLLSQQLRCNLLGCWAAGSMHFFTVFPCVSTVSIVLSGLMILVEWGKMRRWTPDNSSKNENWWFVDLKINPFWKCWPSTLASKAPSGRDPTRVASPVANAAKRAGWLGPLNLAVKTLSIMEHHGASWSMVSTCLARRHQRGADPGVAPTNMDTQQLYETRKHSPKNHLGGSRCKRKQEQVQAQESKAWTITSITAITICLDVPYDTVECCRYHVLVGQGALALCRCYIMPVRAILRSCLDFFHSELIEDSATCGLILGAAPSWGEEWSCLVCLVLVVACCGSTYFGRGSSSSCQRLSTFGESSSSTNLRNGPVRTDHEPQPRHDLCWRPHTHGTVAMQAHWGHGDGNE